jgi:hypothetical protein
LHLRRTPSGVSLSRMCSTFRSHTLDSRVWTVHDHVLCLLDGPFAHV